MPFFRRGSFVYLGKSDDIEAVLGSSLESPVSRTVNVEDNPFAHLVADCSVGQLNPDDRNGLWPGHGRASSGNIFSLVR